MLLVAMTNAQAIIDLRNQLGLTQPEMAELLGCGFRTVCRWEVGGKLTPSALTKLAKLAKQKKVEHLADFFRSVHQAEIISKINRLGTAGAPRSISARELQQWDATLYQAFAKMNFLLNSQKSRMDDPAFQMFREYLNYVEDVRSYIASYAGEHDETALVRPYGSHLQKDESKKLVPRKTPAKRGRPPKSAATKKQLKPQKT